MVRPHLPKNFADKLRDYRLAREWTMPQMAKAAGLSLGTLSRYENGKGVPTPLTAARMRRLLPALFEGAA